MPEAKCAFALRLVVGWFCGQWRAGIESILPNGGVLSRNSGPVPAPQLPRTLRLPRTPMPAPQLPCTPTPTPHPRACPVVALHLPRTPHLPRSPTPAAGCQCCIINLLLAERQGDPQQKQTNCAGRCRRESWAGNRALLL